MMKSVVIKPETRSQSILMMVIAAAVCLSLAQPAFSAVSILGSWTSGATHTKEAGSNRVLLVFAHAEYAWANTPATYTVTYGGQTMTKIAEKTQIYSGQTRAYVAAFILNEAGVAAASTSTISVTWGGSPGSNVITSVFLGGVDQTVPVAAYATGGTHSKTSSVASATVTTPALATTNGDMVIAAVTSSQSGNYSPNSGFTEAIEASISNADSCGDYKLATGAAETPSVTHTFTNNTNREAMVGFVVQALVTDTSRATQPIPGNRASGVSISTNLSWVAPTAYTPDNYDVYFGTNPTSHSNPSQTVDTNSYDPPGNLEYGATYYWAVDSNDGGTIYSGNSWSFTTVILSDRVNGNMMLINDNAGWCWYQDDKIIYDPTARNVLASTSGGDYGFAGASGETRSNDVDATTFNLDTGKRTRVLMAERGGDDHNMGAFWIRPDGKYLHLYCPHYSNPPSGQPLTYYRLSTAAHDGSAWAAESSFNWSTISGIDVTTGGQLTYTNVHYMSGEGTGSGRLYDIVRWNTVTPNIAYSDDWGVTWQYMGRLNKPAGGATYSNYYHKFRSNGVDRIDYIGCENHPRDNDNSVYHGYIKGGKAYNSYGDVIDDNLFNQDACSVQYYTPIFIADVPPLDANSYHTGWTNELELDKNGYPVCLYQTRHGTTPWGAASGSWGNTGAYDHRFFYGRFNGTTWTSTELCKSGIGLHWDEQDYIGMGCIHPNDANIVYVSTNFHPVTDVNIGKREIFKGRTYDNGEHWDWTQITFNSTVDNIRPAVPPWDANNTVVFWERGDFPDQGHFDMVMCGLIEEEDRSSAINVYYYDASISNTKNSDDSAFNPTGPSSSAGAADSRWHEYTGYGNGGSCYTAGDSGTENVPTIKTTVTGLADGTYDVFAYFWCDPSEDWGIRGGFTSSELLCFNRQSSQLAETSQFSGPVTVFGNKVRLYRVYIGRKVVSGGGSIVVYLDNYDSTYATNAPTRTTYDGVGVAPVITGAIPGDLNLDWKVDFMDFAIFAKEWLTMYNMDTLADIADNWLYGT
jgi:hypothetical protein